jgi:hypothetical protein
LHLSDKAPIDVLSSIWQSRKQRLPNLSTAINLVDKSNQLVLSNPSSTRILARNSENKKAGSGHPGRLFSSTIIRL